MSFKGDLIKAGIDTNGISINLYESGARFKIEDTPVLKSRESAIASLTDNTGGTTDGSLAAMPGDSTTTNISADVDNNFAEVNDKLESILTALRNHGLIET